MSAEYGCLGFDKAIQLGRDEEVSVSVSHFRNRAHHDEVMARVDTGPRIDRLRKEIQWVVDLGRIARGEFAHAV
jgi:uncharacterized protein YbaA (DUF1428 family)